MSPLLKKIAIGVGVLAVLYFGYTTLFSTGTEDALITATPNGAPETQAFLLRLEKLKQIKTDTALFDDERFISLEDRRQTIPDEATGRVNPFAPAQ